MKIILILLAISSLVCAGASKSDDDCERVNNNAKVTKNFVDKINTIIIDPALDKNVKVTLIESILSDVGIVQTKKSVGKNDQTIEATVTYQSIPVEGVRICAKNFDGWEFKPCRSDKNGVVNVRIVVQPDTKTQKPYFLILDLVRNQFFIDNNIKSRKIKVKL